MTLLLNKLNARFALQPQDMRAYALIGIWLLVMIALPIAYWVGGESTIPTMITLAAIAQAIAVFYIVQTRWGVARTLRALLIVGALTWLAEAIGSKTGLPFGEYSYTDVLQPQILGVPALIPLAWFMLLPSAWALAQTIVGMDGGLRARLAIAAVSALALTAWDLFLDPQMVGWNFWVWANTEGGYFGIPFINYFGWLLVSFLVTLVVNPAPLPLMPLALVYACVWALQSMGLAFFWGQPAPALFGALGMGGIMLWAYLRHRQAN